MGRILKARDIEAAGVTVRTVQMAQAARAPARLSIRETGQQSEELSDSPSEQRAAAVQAELAEELQRARQILQEITDRVAEHEQRLVEQAGRRLIELGIAIARRILRRQEPFDAAVVQRAAREALEEVPNARDVQVHVNPQDLPAIQDVSDALLEGLDSLHGLTVVPDAEVSPGGIVLHTDIGVVDGEIETQLAEVRAALVELDEAGRLESQET